MFPSGCRSPPRLCTVDLRSRAIPGGGGGGGALGSPASRVRASARGLLPARLGAGPLAAVRFGFLTYEKGGSGHLPHGETAGIR